MAEQNIQVLKAKYGRKVKFTSEHVITGVDMIWYSDIGFRIYVLEKPFATRPKVGTGF
ncbi:hypothetical protein RG963_03430 [Methanosarcina sp. Z-7115]|uniref:Mobile element protein n=1 Tax=Methanosarcina baikalica TaxID=3073890 RepID=A0ABU2CYM5_9EURY|nr:hypothetical protein [Methanosarcina sp. Z-7115]MDR7664852.1 hypothetical protein [Methanosarcina sp. Z-7115]